MARTGDLAPSRRAFQSVPRPNGVSSLEVDVLHALCDSPAAPGTVVPDRRTSGQRGAERPESAPAMPWPNMPLVVLNEAQLRLRLHGFAGPRHGGCDAPRPPGRRWATAPSPVVAVPSRAPHYGPRRAGTLCFRDRGCRDRECPGSALHSDMWSMSTTIPRRIASSSATSPATVSPVRVAIALPVCRHARERRRRDAKRLCRGLELVP